MAENLPFEAWVKYIFDHEVDSSKQEWYWDIDEEFWDETVNPVKTVEYLTRAFEQIDVIAEAYTDAQMNQGVWFLSTNAASSYMFAPLDETVSWELRQRFAASIFTLNERLFLPKCTPHLGHLMREYDPDANPLNMVCYMWWDIVPFFGQPAKPEQREWDMLLLDVMRRTLQLESDACREGALHGLGHWQYQYPEEVQRIVDDFLWRHPDLRPGLISYAKSARGGYVL